MRPGKALLSAADGLQCGARVLVGRDAKSDCSPANLGKTMSANALSPARLKLAESRAVLVLLGRKLENPYLSAWTRKYLEGLLEVHRTLYDRRLNAMSRGPSVSSATILAFPPKRKNV
jgi:hypothetical protein